MPFTINIHISTIRMWVKLSFFRAALQCPQPVAKKQEQTVHWSVVIDN